MKTRDMSKAACKRRLLAAVKSGRIFDRAFTDGLVRELMAAR